MRLSFDDLEALHEGLVARLHAGTVGLNGYRDEWDRLVTFAGWTWHEYADEVDRRWTLNRKTSDAFVC